MALKSSEIFNVKNGDSNATYRWNSVLILNLVFGTVQIVTLCHHE